MRILQISNKIPFPLNDGGAICTFGFTKEFSLQGHTVTFFSLNPKKHKVDLNEAALQVGKYADFYTAPIDTTVKPWQAFRHLFSEESYNISRFFDKNAENSLSELLKTHTFDVVQLEGIFLVPYLRLIRENHKGLIALRQHNVEHQIWERLAANEKNYLKKWYLNHLAKQLKKAETKALSLVDVVIPISSDDEIIFKTLAPHISTHTAPAGVDLEKWHIQKSKSFVNWYHIGALDWHANLEAVRWYLTDIHPKIAQLSENYRFHLAGRNMPNNIQQVQLEKLCIYPKIEDAVAFVQKNDVCVVPLKSGSGIRIKILEAMSAGKLVIATTIGAQGIHYVQGKHLLIANTPDEFVEIYKRLTAAEIDIDAITDAASALIKEEYSIQSVVKQLIEFYEAQK